MAALGAIPRAKAAPVVIILCAQIPRNTWILYVPKTCISGNTKLYNVYLSCLKWSLPYWVLLWVLYTSNILLRAGRLWLIVILYKAGTVCYNASGRAPGASVPVLVVKKDGAVVARRSWPRMKRQNREKNIKIKKIPQFTELSIGFKVSL